MTGRADVVVDGDFGDTGKGKVVDYLVHRGDYAVVICPNGGANSGRTIKVDGVLFKMRQVPSGALKSGTYCFIGCGCVFDPELFEPEIGELVAAGIDVSRIKVSVSAPVVMPWDKVMDKAMEAARTKDAGGTIVGTTGRGIGPAYAAERYRIAPRAVEFLDIGRMLADLPLRYRMMERLLRGFDDCGAVMPTLKDTEDFLKRQADFLLKGDFLKDTEHMTRDFLAFGRDVLVETRNGVLIGIKTGTYPNVTSSDPSIGGALAGSGIPPQAVRRVIMVLKAFMSRVGSGPFPTEQDNEIGDLIRQKAGDEVGTVSGRVRRVGWRDMVTARYAARAVGATEAVVTKLDVLTGINPLKVAVYYGKEGRLWHDHIYSPNSPMETFTPHYEDMRGWLKDISGITDGNNLPGAARRYVQLIQSCLGIPVRYVGTGKERDAMIDFGPEGCCFI